MNINSIRAEIKMARRLVAYAKKHGVDDVASIRWPRSAVEEYHSTMFRAHWAMVYERAARARDSRWLRSINEKRFPGIDPR